MVAEAGFPLAPASVNLSLLPALAAGNWEHGPTVITATQLSTRQKLSQSSIF